MSWQLPAHATAPLRKCSPSKRFCNESLCKGGSKVASTVVHKQGAIQAVGVVSRAWAGCKSRLAAGAALRTDEQLITAVNVSDTGPAPTAAARATLNGVAAEQRTEVEAVVTGHLPSWLSGSLLANGGGDYSHMTHQFDGYALVSKVRVQGGRAWGSQRYLATKAYRDFKQQGRVTVREYNTPPEPFHGPFGSARLLLSQLFGAVSNNVPITDNACVSLAPAGAVSREGQGSTTVLAMTESVPGNYLIDPDNLSIIKQVQYDDGIPGAMISAHPHVLSDGTFVNFSRETPKGGLHLYKQDPVTLKRTEVAFIPDRRPMTPSWIHDFAVTDSYAVIVETPLYMSLPSLMLGKLGGDVSHLFMNWIPEDDVTVHVVPLHGQAGVRSFTCPTFFTLHVGNAYESQDGTTLYVDLTTYDSPDILLDFTLDKLRSPTVDGAGMHRSYYSRLTVPLDPNANGSRLQAPAPLIKAENHHHQHQHQHQDAPMGDYCEFPVINRAHRGKLYRYAYSHSAVRPTTLGNALSKMDVELGTAKTWSVPGGAVGEPAFVARPGATSEDDGVVVASGVGPDGKSFMVVLDAEGWTELARVKLPYGTPHRFHGMWLQRGVKAS